MSLNLPWHSSSNRQPTEVTQFINHVNSVAGTLIFRTDAGMADLKALGNPDGPHTLVKDLLGTHLRAILSLTTFDYAVNEILIGMSCRFFNGWQYQTSACFCDKWRRCFN
jgi:hypothetical protein